MMRMAYMVMHHTEVRSTSKTMIVSVMYWRENDDASGTQNLRVRHGGMFKNEVKFLFRRLFR